DLPATVCDLVAGQGGRPFPGASLARCWCGSGGPATTPFSGRALPRAAPPRAPPSPVLDPYHYLPFGDGREELYDFRADRLEVQDLAGSDAGRGPLEQLRAGLKEIDARMTRRG